MRFVAFEIDNREGLAIEKDGQLKGLHKGDSEFPGTLKSLIEGGQDCLAAAAKKLEAGRLIDPDGVRFLPPVENSGKIICVGLNYADHAEESSNDVPDYPVLFSRFNSSLIGHGTPMIRPMVSESLDFEGELAAVIGAGGRHIDEDVALDHVIGYAVFNDATIRDYQFKSGQWMVGKNFDGTGGFGPAFVTADELPAGASGLSIETRLNGETVQSSNTDNMIFSVARLVSVVSEAISLEPGDVIVTGTPSGIGYFREPKLFMRPGDVCEVEIEGIGLLQNPIVAEDAAAVSQELGDR